MHADAVHGPSSSIATSPILRAGDCDTPARHRKKCPRRCRAAYADRVRVRASVEEPHRTLGHPCRSVLLQRNRGGCAGVVIIAELEAATRADLVRRPSEEIFAGRSQRQAGWPGARPRRGHPQLDCSTDRALDPAAVLPHGKRALMPHRGQSETHAAKGFV